MNLLITDIANIPVEAQCGAVTIGNFDGVHRGHRSIVAQVRALADKVSGPAVVFTFDPPPARLLRPNEAPEALTNMERRAELLTQLGIDYVVVCPTTLELLQLEPEDFFAKVMVQSLKCKAIAEGANFHFGRKRRGDVVMLTQLCAASDIEFSLLTAQKEDGDWISSTRVRKEIEVGNLLQANRLLIEPYRISGIVRQGDQRGRTLGFPTANLEKIPMLCPPPGVYCGRLASVQSSQDQKIINASHGDVGSAIGFPVAINIGPNPTFGVNKTKVEAHIIGFEGDIYGYEIAIELLDRIRDVRKFASKEELLAQLAMDIVRTKEVVASNKLT
jgi:riboflavin kinase / FMN adenylyltransferase